MTQLSTILLAAAIGGSVTYQVVQANKMKKAAREAAEQRKGFELVVEGNASAIPLVYGRAKIGGIRVWHNTSSTHHVPPGFFSNADKVIDLGPAASAPKEISGVDENGDTYTITLPGNAAGLLGESLKGSKNEFLYFQQVLCHGPINAVKDFVVDESRFADDPTLTSYRRAAPGPNNSYVLPGEVKAAIRQELHYNGWRNHLIAANFPDREYADFPGLAYSNVIIRLDRDEPQFNSNVPMVQYFIEGRLVRKSVNGVLTQRVYSNNPAWCLLDYLLASDDLPTQFDPGKGLSLQEIDLASFEAAAAICDKIVKPNALTYGNIWRPLNEAQVETRNVPLYECNIVLDPSKTVRDNVEALLATMGDARLVWSDGKYKLLLQYPSTNSEIELATKITDDQLVHGEPVNIQWPSTSERLNHAIVRFNNESENFKEDSVSWPPKRSFSEYKGIGGYRYPASNSGTGPLLSSIGVWAGDENTSRMVWRFLAPVSGTYKVSLQIDDRGSIEIASDMTGFRLTTNGHKNVATGNVTLVANQVYTITIEAEDTGGEKAAAASLALGNFVYWTTREPAWQGFEKFEGTSELYDTFKEEDNGLNLETSIFLDGCSDYYHALAKAEEMVRTSRSAVSVEFKYVVTDCFLEPGDIIQLESQTLNIGDTSLYLRVNEVKLLDNGICEVKGSRFDYTQLAWNVADDEYKVPPNLYNFEVPAPRGLEYVAEFDNLLNSAGKLVWPVVELDSIAGYIAYAYILEDNDAEGKPIFRELGRTSTNSFILPPIVANSVVFGVRTYTKSNRQSRITTTGSQAIVLRDLFRSRSVTLTSDSPIFVKNRNREPAPTAIVFTATAEGFYTPVFKWLVDDVLETNATGSTFSLPSFTEGISKIVKVQVYEGTTEIFAEDTVTVSLLDAGSDKYTMVVPQENITLLAYSDGSLKPASALPITFQADVYRGADKITPDTFVINPDDVTASVAASGLVTITEVNNSFAAITVAARVGLELVNRVVKLITVRDGESIQPRVARINAPRLSFLTLKNTTTQIPSQIVLESFSTGFQLPSYQWYVDDEPVVGATDSTFSLPSFPPTTTSKSISLLVTETAANTPENKFIYGQQREDSITIFSLREGDDSYNATIEDENRTLPADNLGNIIAGYLPYTTDVVVVQGMNEITSSPSVTYAIDSTSNVTATISTSGVLTISALSAEFGTATVKISIENGPTLYKTHTVSKAVKGTTGNSLDIIYIRSVAKPAKPSPSQTTPANWFTNPDAVPAGAGYIWSSVGVRIGNEVNFSWQEAVKLEGTFGVSIAELTIYKRSATVLSTAPTGGSFNFASGVTTPPTGWSAVVPDGNDPLYVSKGLGKATDGANTSGVITWSAPSVMAKDGSTGASVDIVFIRSETAPSAPTASPGTPANWYTDVNSVPAGAGYIWSSVGTRAVNSVNFVWNNPVQIEGTYGTSVVEVVVYKRSASVIATAPTGGSYNFRTKTLTPPTGWSVGFPEGTDPVYSVRSSAVSENNAAFDDTLTWSTPVLTVKNGERGATGSSINIVYKRATTTPTTPAASEGVPATWYDDPANVPAGAGYIWSSVGVKLPDGTTYTWQAPIRVEGTIGKAIAEISIYIRSATAPATPTTGSFDFSTSVITPPSGWSGSVPTGNDPLYITKALVSAVDGATAVSSISWAAPVLAMKNGDPGASLDIIFIRSATKPTTPAASAATPANWYTDISSVPAGTGCIWSSVGTKAIGATNFVWKTPSQIEGSMGQSIAELSIYKRSASALTAPSGGSFNFSTKTLTPPTGWSTTIPDGTDPVYISLATAVGESTTSVDTTLTWTTPSIAFKNGDKGDPGVSSTVDISGIGTFRVNTGGAYTPATLTLSAVTSNITSPTYAWSVTNGSLNSSTASSVTLTPTNNDPKVVTLTVNGSNLSSSITVTRVVNTALDGVPGQVGLAGLMTASPTIYQWVAGASAPTRPASSSTYTWLTGVISSLPAGWSSTIPANSSDDQTLWAITIPLTVSAEQQTSTLTWSDTTYPLRAVSYRGKTGSPGSPGGQGPASPGTYVINRGASTTSSAPTDSEVYSKLTRYAVVGDIATVVHSSGAGSVTYQATAGGTGATWSQLTTWISGSVIVEGSISGSKIVANSVTADKIDSRSLTIKDANGNIVFSAGNGVSASLVTGLGSLATQSSVTTAQVSGLGSLATQSSVTTAQVSGLGSLATKSSLGYTEITGTKPPSDADKTSSNIAAGISNQGAFATVSQITSSNVSTYIASAAIGSAQIDTLTVSKLSSGTASITEGSFRLGGSSLLGAAFNSIIQAGSTATDRAAIGGVTTSTQVPANIGVHLGQGFAGGWYCYKDGYKKSQLVGGYNGYAVTADLFEDSSATKKSSAQLATASYSVYGILGKIYSVSGFGPFTGMHDGIMSSTPEIGDILIDDEILLKESVSSSIASFKLSSVPCEKGAIGVCSEVHSPEKHPDAWGIHNTYPPLPTTEMPNFSIPAGMFVVDANALGEGYINVCGENGNLGKGDLIVTSSTPGKGMRQSDDIIRSYTVAKAREAVVFDNPSQVKQVACVYLCG